MYVFKRPALWTKTMFVKKRMWEAAGNYWNNPGERWCGLGLGELQWRFCQQIIVECLLVPVTFLGHGINYSSEQYRQNHLIHGAEILVERDKTYQLNK